MTKHRRSTQSNPAIQDLNVVDLILIDHQFVKECIDVLTDEKADKRKKLSVGREFLEAVATHSMAEKKSIYTPLENNETLHFNILEAEIEHGIVDQKVRSLRIKLSGVRTLRDEVEAELKVLAELVKHHIIEEESNMLPKMKEVIDEEQLSELGKNFMKARNFTAKDLMNYPQLQNDLVQWKDSIQKVSSEFLSKMDKFVENLQH